MDCERLDSLAIDLIDPDGSTELDPRTTREAEEHLAGCSRCSSAIERLRGGLRAAAELPLEDPSSLLEARILAAAGAVKPEASFSRRVVRAITTAGAWAMRPQVAMAAVLVVMVGTSVVLLRGGGVPGAHRTKVTEEGTPVATLEPAAPAEQGAPAVIGGDNKADKEKPKETPKAEDVPRAPDVKKADDSILAEKEAKEESKPATKTPAKDLEGVADEDGNAYGTTAGAAGGAKGKAGPVPMAPPPPPAAAAPAPAQIGGLAAPGDFQEKAADKNEVAKKSVTATPSPTSTSAPGSGSAPASYDEAMNAYKEARYAVAAKGFDAAAASGQKVPSALLYAGRSYRATGSCPLALPRFQKVVNSYPASPEAPHAALEGGQCAKSVGDIGTARALFERAKTYPATQKQAENELAALDKPAQASPPAKAKAAKPSVDY